MTIKIKTKNKLPDDNRKTLDTIHQRQVKNFRNLRKSIPTKQKEIKKLQDQIEQFNKLIDQSKDDPVLFFDLRNQKRTLENKIIDIENDIKNIGKSLDEDKYILNIGCYVSQYYNNIENSEYHKELQREAKKRRKKNIKKTVSLLDYFDDDDEEQDSNGNDIIQELNQTPKIKVQSMTNQEIYDTVMPQLDSNYVPQKRDDFEGDLCLYCQSECILDQVEGKLICSKCDNEEYILIDSDKPSYKEKPKEMTNFAYKRLNHFSEILSQFQGRETTEIPDNVYQEILAELKKQKITSSKELTYDKLRSILKKIDQARYYEHIHYIIYQLTGIKPPVIDDILAKKLKEMFQEVQGPFTKYRPNGRKNFLSYSYILYKFFELLERDEYLPYLTLLKSREKLHQQDLIWEKICEELGYEFIASF